ncbi:MAG: hypothetical protein ACFFEN_13160 [Candidatus Thorarchaeota archaeon]
MLNVILFPIIGIVFISFRIWLVIFKVKDELQFRRFYVSRLVNFYFCFMLIFNFKNPIFNVIVAVCFPAMIFTSLWDINFYKGFKSRNYWEKNKNWVLIERMTMHPPILVGGLSLYIIGLQKFIPSNDLVPFLLGILIVYLTSFLLDIRLRKRYNWPNGRNLFLVMFISTSLFSLYYILSHLLNL